ncbi:MAG: diguanylate cyclase domain-containing protein, partial [Ralstonia sp.]
DEPATEISAQAAHVLQSTQIAVFPQAVRVGWRAITASKLLRVAPTLSIRSSNDDVLHLFNRQPDLHAVALLDEAQRPLALIARRAFIDRYAMPYHRELYGKKAALAFANRQPVLVEKSASLEDMSALLMSDDQRYLTDGFIITENGRYLGLGTGEELVRTVTEIRIEAARYANPLTFLPGNIPLNLHIERLLEARAEFFACYVDLNHFKPFNDQYGYWQGDEMLKMGAAVLASACEPTRDFLGHVGGDDFLILFQSDDWEARIKQAMATFNDNALGMYTPADRAAGGIHAEDRKGLPAFFRFVTMAVGALHVLPGAARNSDDIGTAAALAKRRAKQSESGFYLEPMLPGKTRQFEAA